MKTKTRLIGWGLVLLLCGFYDLPVMAAPACKGPNKNDPGCNQPAAPAGTVDSVTVDWFDQKLVVRGSGLTGFTSFGLGAFPGPLATANVTDTQLDIPFNADLAGEVQGQGSYLLTGDGTAQLTVFIDSQIVDPAATGCPCEAEWAAALASWGTPGTDCVETAGPGVNDPADITGTILSNPADSTQYPQYPISASFYPGLPEDSVCRLVELDGSVSPTELVNHRINENQQADCRNVLALNVCSTISQLP